MLAKAGVLATMFLAAALFCRPASAQPAPATILTIELENQVNYRYDVADPLKFATDPGVTSALVPKNFQSELYMSDVVAINGQPAKGLRIVRSQVVTRNPSPASGQAIADLAGAGALADMWQILKPDGTPIGTLVGLGTFTGGGPPDPGAPLAAISANIAIVGGTGAFLGARGVAGQAASLAPLRVASITEDPSNRRKTTGGKAQWVIYLIPMERPELVIASGSPQVFHADLTPVTSAKPAKAGEALITMATGLGPTRPGVDPGQPFPAYPANPLQAVNSPVEVKVNGQSAEVINAIGWPELVNTYRVDFRVPSGTASGTMGVQLTAAWIAGSTVQVPIQ